MDSQAAPSFCLLRTIVQRRFWLKLQSWTKVLGTVQQYSYFSVICRFPLKTVHPFRNFLAVLPLPTLHKAESPKKFWRHASNIVCGVRGAGLDLCELENAPERQKCPKTFVHDCSLLGGWRGITRWLLLQNFVLKISPPLKSNILCHYSNAKIFCYCIVPLPKWTLFQIEKFYLSFSIIPLQPSLTWKLCIGN